MIPRILPSLSVLTLNIRFGLADDGPQAWAYRRPVLGEFLGQHACDIMMFQEANDFQIDFVAECLPHHDIIGRRHPAPPFWQNNIICFRAPWQLDRWTHLFLSPTPHIPSRFPDSRWPRQSTMGRFHQGRHELVCATTHLDFAESVQTASAEIILAHLNPLAGDRPAILAGDFNCTPTSACHAAFTHPSTTPEEGRSGFQNVLSPPFAGTFHGFRGGRGRTCIDWILYRGAITLQQARVVRFSHATCYPSDHYPVTADFIWQEASAP